uniref:hypothetical protein n=2 Tax=Flavobacterium sp. TaxID=239 RepID=UPI00404A78E7
MKKIILLLLLGTLFSCQKNHHLKEVSLYFSPLFYPNSIFKIDVEHNTIEQITYRKAYNLKEFDKTTAYEILNNDTLIVYFKKTFEVTKSDLNKFMNEIHLSQLDSSIIHGEKYIDGVGFRVSKISTKNDTISLTSLNARRTEQFKMDFKILDAFFELAFSSIDDYNGITVIEDIQSCFPYGLHMKKISNNPIEYRFWGKLSGCRDENKELLDFLNELPDKKPIIFDLRNGSYSPCLQEVFSEFEQKKNIYYYGSEYFSLFNYRIEQIEIQDSIKNKDADLNSYINFEIDSLPKSENKAITKEKLEAYKQDLIDGNSFETRAEVIEAIERDKKIKKPHHEQKPFK